MQETFFAFDDFELDVLKLELWRGGQLVPADTLALRLLSLFVRSAGELLTKDYLLQRAWQGRIATENSLMVAMTRLRRALGQRPGGPTWLVTVHGHGYRFVRPVVQRQSATPARSGTSELARTRSPFVGRHAALAALDDALEAMRTGRGGVFLLSGEAGIGKTRLAEVFAERALQRDVGVSWGYCHEQLDTPALWPFVQILRDVMLSSRAGQAAMEHPGLEHMRAQLARLLPELASDASPTPSAASAPHAKLLLFDAVTQWLMRVTADRPWIIVFDDMHRAEPASLELLLYLLPALRRMHCLVIASVRDPDLSPSDNRTALRRVLAHRNSDELRLARLELEQVSEFVSAWLGHTDADVSQRVYELSEGNPFFMLQLTHSLRSNQAYSGMLPLPERLLDLLRERFAALTPEALSDLQVAAVQGRRFSLTVLRTVTGREQSELITSIDAALGGGMVTAIGDSQSEFAFSHELLRDALYRTVPDEQRRSQHLRIGETLELQLVQGLESSPAELAYHFRCALPVSDARKVIALCAQAASAASAVFAFADAARHLKHALAALDFLADGSPRLRLKLLWGLAFYVRPLESHEFPPLIRQVIRLASQLRNGEQLARAGLLLSTGSGFPSFPGWHVALQDALTLLPASAHELRAAALARLATAGPLAYDEKQACSQLEDAQALARETGAVLDRYLVLDADLYLHGGPAHRQHAAATARQIDELAVQHPNELAIAPLFLDVHSAIVELQNGDQPAAQRALERMSARVQDFGGALWWHIDRFRVLCRVNAYGATSERAALLALSNADARHHAGGAEVLCAYDRSVVLGQQLSDADRPWLRVEDSDAPGTWALKTRAALAGGFREDALRALQHLRADQLAALPCDRDYLGTLGALAHVAIALDARSYIEALHELLAPHRSYFAVGISFHCEGSISTVIGMLAHALGRQSDARRALAEGLRASQAAGYKDCVSAARQLLEVCGRG